MICSLDSWFGDNQERLSLNYNVSATDIQQTYAVPFVYAIQDGGVTSIMCAYDSQDGYPMCMHPSMQNILREQLGFKGFVVSDLGAIQYAYDHHHAYPNLTAAVAAALNAGTDLALGGEFAQTLQEALDLGLIQENDINKALRRAMMTRFQLGM